MESQTLFTFRPTVCVFLYSNKTFYTFFSLTSSKGLHIFTTPIPHNVLSLRTSDEWVPSQMHDGEEEKKFKECNWKHQKNWGI
jgi:hypothetical protein